MTNASKGRFQTDGNVAALGKVPGIFGVFPVSLTLRQSIGRHVEISGTLDAAHSGFDLRGSFDRASGSPIVLSASFRTGVWSLTPAPTYEGRLRSEMYPVLVERGEASTRLVLGGGVAAGNFRHYVIVDDAYEQTNDVVSLPPDVEITRPELRLEGAIGFSSHSPGVWLAVVLMPWIAAATGEVTVRETDWTVQSFSQNVGLSLVLTVSFGGEPFTRTYPGSSTLSR